jgi:WD40 repeat protein
LRRADGAGWSPRATLACGGEVLGAVISADGGVIATTSRPASLRFWSTADGKLLHHTAMDKVGYKPVFSPDGRWLATGMWDLAIRFWYLSAPPPPTTTPLPRGSATTSTTTPSVLEARHDYSLLGHSQLISAQAFDESGGLLASVSNDGALRIWDLSGMAPRRAGDGPLQDRRRCLATLDAGVGDAYAVTFLPAGVNGERSVAVGYIDGSVHVWKLGSFDAYLRGHVEHQARLRGRTAADAGLLRGNDGPAR